MKTKIKTKNEFQNPDLIFGNEIQKRKLKLKNRILKSIMACVAIITLIMASALDSNSWIPYITVAICMMILFLFLIANWDLFVRTYVLPYKEWNKMEEWKMKIEVKVDDEVVFYGLAEDYLFMNDNDVELELLLDKMESMPYNSIVKFEETEIEKLEYNLYD